MNYFLHVLEIVFKFAVRCILNIEWTPYRKNVPVGPWLPGWSSGGISTRSGLIPSLSKVFLTFASFIFLLLISVCLASIWNRYSRDLKNWQLDSNRKEQSRCFCFCVGFYLGQRSGISIHGPPGPDQVAASVNTLREQSEQRTPFFLNNEQHERRTTNSANCVNNE